MPRPIPAPVRRAVFRLWEQGQAPGPIAEALGLPAVSVRRLIRRFRLRGVDGLAPDYPTAPDDPAPTSDLARAALRLRREHPTWGAGLIRVQLLGEDRDGPLPSVRTLQRWFLRADLAPAPTGRRPRGGGARATTPHETWQMDAKDHIGIRTGEQVSWLRLVDECSGAALWTAVFPPREVEPGPVLGRARPTASGLRPLGTPREPPRRQRHAVGIAGGLADRAGVVVDRVGDRDDLEHAAATPGERRD